MIRQPNSNNIQLLPTTKGIELCTSVGECRPFSMEAFAFDHFTLKYHGSGKLKDVKIGTASKRKPHYEDACV